MSGMNEVLGQLFDKNSIVLPSGPEVKIKKVTLRTMKPVMDLIATVLDNLSLSADNLPTVDLQNPAFLLKLISNHYDQVIDLGSQLCSLSKDELLDLETDESVLVIGAIITLNKDFFTKKVLPNLRHLESIQQS